MAEAVAAVEEEDLLVGLELCNDFGPDAVIAIGGGSVIDMAKMINFFTCHKFDVKEYINAGSEKDINECKPLVVLPTTSGTGSEATHFAVLYIDKVKYSIAEEVILPDIAIIDINETSSTRNKAVSPRDYRGMISAWYFTRST